MIQKVFSVSGNKISSLLVDENSLKFSSQKPSSVEAFQDAWVKKLSLATKVEVKYDTVKSIKKEDKDKSIVVKYKTWAGVPGECEFSFDDPSDYVTFFNFLENERYFTKTQETEAPFRAVRGLILVLVVTVAFGIFGYYQAIAIANGTAETSTRGKARLFNLVVSALGDKGVIAVTAIVVAFLILHDLEKIHKPSGPGKIFSTGHQCLNLNTLKPLDTFYSNQQEPVKSCLLALRDLILKQDAEITHELKYGMPFFCYKGKMFCYLWFHKKLLQPYLGIVEGGAFDEAFLIPEKRSKMKIMLIAVPKRNNNQRGRQPLQISVS